VEASAGFGYGKALPENELVGIVDCGEFGHI
jgi:hypothetical protein